MSLVWGDYEGMTAQNGPNILRPVAGWNQVNMINLLTIIAACLVMIQTEIYVGKGGINTQTTKARCLPSIQKKRK